MLLREAARTSPNTVTVSVACRVTLFAASFTLGNRYMSINFLVDLGKIVSEVSGIMSHKFIRIFFRSEFNPSLLRGNEIRVVDELDVLFHNRHIVTC